MRNYANDQTQTLSVLWSHRRVGLFWDLLVAYANQDLSTPQSWIRAGLPEPTPAYRSAFDKTAHLLLASRLIPGLSYVEPDYDPYEGMFEEDRSGKILRTASRQLRQGSKMFKDALTWICLQGKPRPLRFMRASDASKFPLAVLGRYPTISAEDERFVEYLEKRGVYASKRKLRLMNDRLLLCLDRPRNVVDLFCAFIVEQCAGNASKELPLRHCANIECGRFFLVARKTGKFCSDNCRAKSYWTREKRRKYMRKWRLAKLSPGIRRKKAKDDSQ